MRNRERHERQERQISQMDLSPLPPQLGLVTLTRRASEGERFPDVKSGSPSLFRFEVAHAETVVRLREALDTSYGLKQEGNHETHENHESISTSKLRLPSDFSPAFGRFVEGDAQTLL